ncbi:10194_t:CDS:2, partial [Entrophospora sp. SA101]
HHSNSSTGNLYKHLRSQHPTKLNTNEKNITVTGTLNHFVQSKKLPLKAFEIFLYVGLYVVEVGTGLGTIELKPVATGCNVKPVPIFRIR